MSRQSETAKMLKICAKPERHQSHYIDQLLHLRHAFICLAYDFILT